MPRNIPWDRVRGEVLRSLIKELGLKDYNKLKREQMIELLEEMETEGCKFIYHSVN